MCGGGGSSPEPIDPMKQAEADIRVLQQQYEFDQQRLQEQLAREAATEAQGRTDFDRDLSANRAKSYDTISQQFGESGIDALDYESQINAALDREASGLTYGDRPVFGTDIGSNLMDTIRKSQIRDYQSGINSFAPEGFEQEAFASTSDDAIIDAILAEQFGTASDSILRARDRGTLNDAGFQYAMDNLGTQKTAANSRLQSTGGGILEDYRGQLGGIADNARTGAGNWDFGDSYTPDTYRSQIESRQGELSGGLEGAIRNAIGGEQFFNTSDLIQKGGVSQGAQNTGLGSQSGGLLGAITQRKSDEEKSRGLGTSGSF